MSYRPSLQVLYWRHGGKCHWCKRLTVGPNDPKYLRRNGLPKGDSAARDHVYSRLHPLRLKPTTGPRIVLACLSCNQKRSNVECIVISLNGELEPRIYPPDEPVPTRRQRRKLAIAAGAGR